MATLDYHLGRLWRGIGRFGAEGIPGRAGMPAVVITSFSLPRPENLLDCCAGIQLGRATGYGGTDVTCHPNVTIAVCSAEVNRA